MVDVLHYSAVDFHVALLDAPVFNNSVQLKIVSVHIFIYFEKKLLKKTYFFWTRTLSI